jgi:hypothetical protein
MRTFLRLFLPLPALRAVNLMRLRAFIVTRTRTGVPHEDFPHCPGERDEFAGIAGVFGAGIAATARPLDDRIEANLRLISMRQMGGHGRRDRGERVR